MTGIFRRAERVFRPWKNGGGQTAEIVAWPAGADFDAFEWRISTAIVAASGPFSTFPGVDRVITVLEGGAMVLTAGGEARKLDAGSQPYSFPGDVPAAAELEGEPLLDFNVMVRRPLRAQVARGPFAPASQGVTSHARLALLLEDRAGLSRFDLVDVMAADPSLIAALVGTPALDVRISN
ncbi:hypothetical protein SLNSH_09255 [Alsobacter soli]|uniref:HutD-family protein n=1 Tax=Alsobacter soli TaxID=2109933 RepID=A0A2T1HUR1_9HYPH|nr:HutD family protein [Alsobacter soli]PSC05374.1 hypothetical protein SLNSH_09255 [Alsobacter soli]